MIASTFLFIPINIYSYFITGVIQGSIAIFFITLVFSEIARITGSSFSRQEVLLLYYAAAWGSSALPIYYNIIYRSFLVNSPLSKTYVIGDKPLIKYIPAWLAPPPESYTLRSLFQPVFVVPLLVWFIWSVILLALTISLSLLCANIYVERLDYPFPYVVVETSLATFIAERPKGYMKYFIPSFVVGIIFGTLAYLPFSFESRLIPIPYIDLTPITEELLPGAVIGVTTILSSYFGGLIVPFNHAILMLLSSIIVWVVLNSLFITRFSTLFPEWAKEYAKGMGLIAVYNRSYLRVWFAPQIGFMLASIIFLLIFKIRHVLTSVFREILFPSSVKRRVIAGLPSLRLVLFLWLLFAFVSAIFFHILVPEVNILIPLAYVFLVGFFVAILGTAVRGETGFSIIGLPGLTWATLMYFSPYQGYAGFVFQPPTIDGDGPPSFSQQVKAASITGIKPRDLLVIWIVGYFLSQLSGLIALDFFWRIAPIPSSAYPFTVYNSLNTAHLEAMIVSRQIDVSLSKIFLPSIILLFILSAGTFISKLSAISFPFLGLIAGLYLPPYSVISLFTGSLISKYIAPRFLGGFENWRKIIGYVTSGELSGEGLILMLSVTISLMRRSAWLWPW
ncbi:hypothetical protein KEJ14_04250 [Candidatus Bathyarchaeota archaeon]|nr:hypothetical protein [Candidatus Bathyarchaeota archaeon]